MAKFPGLLLKQRYEVVVLDYYIFYYFLKKQLQENTVKYIYQEIASSPLLPEVKAYAGFNDKKLRDAFNKQLSIFKKANKDQTIIESYIGSIDSFGERK